MAGDRESKQSGCCTFEFPDIPAPWLLFIEFAFTFGTTIVYFADIITDIITLRMYYQRGWLIAFYASIAFIVLPSILLAVLEFNFLKKTYGKSLSWKTILLRTVLNVPFQLTVIWYHINLSYTFLCNWLNHIRGIDKKNNTTSQWYEPTTLERSRGASLSSLNELDFYQRGADEMSDMQGSALVPPPAHISQSMPSLVASDSGQGNNREKDNWWNRLTREQWLSHLNKLKLSESMLESLPQLLINLFLIARHTDTQVVQYISAVISYLSLCGGVVRYDKTRKDNEADRWMVDRTLLHSRIFYTRLEWPQVLFVALYKGSFLAARILAFVFFTLYFGWFILIPILLHWGVLLCYLVYRWYPDFHKVTRQLQQADYRYRAYMFLSHDFTSVLLTSLMGIFIHVRPYYHAFLDQPYCFMFWYYVTYVTENAALFLAPGIVFSLQEREEYLNKFQYYALMGTDLFLNVAGCLLCVIYYLAVHKMRAFTAHAYPAASRLLCRCYMNNHHVDDDDDEEYWLPVDEDWTVCKQAETSEIFYLTKSQLKSFHQKYNTVVRQDRFQGRAVECFIDDRCQIFYAPRSKMKKMKTQEVNSTLPRPSLRLLNDTTRAEAVPSRREDPIREDLLMEERMMRDRERASRVFDDEEEELLLEDREDAPLRDTAADRDTHENNPETDGRTIGVRFSEDHKEDEDDVQSYRRNPNRVMDKTASASRDGGQVGQPVDEERQIQRPVPKARTKSFQKPRPEVPVAANRKATKNDVPLQAPDAVKSDESSQPPASVSDSDRSKRSARRVHSAEKSGSNRGHESKDPHAASAIRSSSKPRRTGNGRYERGSSSSGSARPPEERRTERQAAPRTSSSRARAEPSKNGDHSKKEQRRAERAESPARIQEQNLSRSASKEHPREVISGPARSKAVEFSPPALDSPKSADRRQRSTHSDRRAPSEESDITNELPGWQQTWI